MIAFTASRSFV